VKKLESPGIAGAFSFNDPHGENGLTEPSSASR
jgi:hypothetical protein